MRKATRNFTLDSRIPGPLEYEELPLDRGLGSSPELPWDANSPHLFKNALSIVGTSQSVVLGSNAPGRSGNILPASS